MEVAKWNNIINMIIILNYSWNTGQRTGIRAARLIEKMCVQAFIHPGSIHSRGAQIVDWMAVVELRTFCFYTQRRNILNLIKPVQLTI